MRNQSARPSKIIVEPTHHGRWREGVLTITIALSVFLLLALVTYHRLDMPSANNPSWQNAGGRVGAMFADILFYIFGYFAYLFPFMLSYSAWLGCKSIINEDETSHRFPLLRTLGFIATLIAGCGLLSLQSPQFYEHLPFNSGGVLGDLIGFGLAATVNKIGATVLLFGLFLSGITLFTGFSWMNVITVTGYLTLLAASAAASVWSTIQQKRSASEGRPEKLRQEIREPVLNYDDIETLPKRKTTRVEPQITAVATQRFEVQTPQAEPAPLTSLLHTPQSSALNKKKDIPLPTTKIFNSVKNQNHELPSLDLLDPPEQSTTKNYSNAALENMSREVEMRLLDFGITVQVVAVHPGPVVTRYELQLAAGLKVSKVTGLVKDLARSLSVPSVRVVEVIPGKSVIGLELPNDHRQIVRLSEVLTSQQYEQARSPLSLALGKDIAGHPVVVDLAKMPHLLVAGTTGAGKSVGLNAMLLSLLFKATPEEVRMIMIDPKMLELSIYEGIPHLLTPVVTDMKEAANALRWCVAEMDRRYKLMASLGVRNLAGYNAKIQEAEKAGNPIADPLWTATVSLDEEAPKLSTLPFIVVLVDEFADMMMVVGKKVEELIARIAQKARAAGIHLILATQRPSVDVITGLIKANIPTRIAFQVSSKIDSRTILDQQGAEQLLGHGDMLYLAPGTGIPVRVHGAYVADQEVHKVVDDWKQRGEPEYITEILENRSDSGAEGGDDEDGSGNSEQDPLYDQAVQIVIESRRASISSVQRRLKIGYNRAARLIEDMEKAGLVSPMESNGTREVLVPAGNN